MLSEKDEEKAKALVSTLGSIIFVLCFILIVGVVTLKDTKTSNWTVCTATTGETAEAVSHKGDTPQIVFTYIVDGMTYSQLVKESSLLENKNYDADKHTLKIVYDPNSPGEAVPWSSHLWVDYALLVAGLIALPLCFFVHAPQRHLDSMKESLKLRTTSAAKSAYIEYEKPHCATFTVEDLHHQATPASEKS